MEQRETPENSVLGETSTETDLERAKEEVNFWSAKMYCAREGTPEYAEVEQKHREAWERYRKIGQQRNPAQSTPKSERAESASVIKHYTLEDYEREKNWDSGFGPNNPGAERRWSNAHYRRLREIRASLIAQGLLEKTETEKITEIFDGLYPNVKHKTIIAYNGKKYQIRYLPLEQSNSGKTVFEWGHAWQLMEDK